MSIAEPQVAEPLATRRNQIPRGIAYMVASTIMFAGVNAIVKWELETYPIGEVAFFRSLFAFLAVAAMILPRTGIAVLRTRRYREHLQRGLSQFGSMTCMFVAFRALSLGSAIAISFSAPLFTTLLSILILKERVGVHRWSALIVGFVGVLVITLPDAGALNYGAFFALANAVLISSVAIAIRRMSATESTETLTFYQMSVITVCTIFIMKWRRIRPNHRANPKTRRRSAPQKRPMLRFWPALKRACRSSERQCSRPTASSQSLIGRLASGSNLG
jgi:drug/metabolite transporter (DMT)-like permease